MGMICAAIPAAAAIGAKLNADQLQKPPQHRRPIARITGLVITLLLSASIVYHSLPWQN